MSLCAKAFVLAGNALQPTSTGFQCGHEPCHSSKSATCVTIEASKDQFYCSSCHVGGGPIQAVMHLNGCSYAEAAAQVQAMGGTLPARTGKPPEKESHLAATLAAQYAGTLAYDGAGQRWLRYGAETPGIWSPPDREAPDERGFAQLQQDLDTLRPDGFSYTFARGVERLLRSRLLAAFPPCPPDCLPLLNGRLQLATLQLTPFAASEYATWCLPFAWDATATCPLTWAWLRAATCDDDGHVQVLRAFLKAMLLGRVDLQRFVELIGPGGSGKGTFVRLATALVGQRNTFATELRRLETNRFETANVRGKRLICITDAERYAGEVTVLKALTGGDLLPFEEKGKQARIGMAEGLVLLASNEAIMSADYTSGLARRRLTVPFVHRPVAPMNLLSFHGSRIEGTLAGELPGVLRWVLALPDTTMERLLQQTTQTVRSLADAQAQNLVKVNPLASWADDALLHDTTRDASGKLPKTYVGVARRVQAKETAATYENSDIWLYAHYCESMEASNNKALSLWRFSELLKDLCVHQLRLAHVCWARDKQGAHFRALRLRRADDTTSARLITADTDDGETDSEPLGDDSETDFPLDTPCGDGDDGLEEEVICIEEEEGSPRVRARAPGSIDPRIEDGSEIDVSPSSSSSDNEINELDSHHSITDDGVESSSPLAAPPEPVVTVGAPLDTPPFAYLTSAAQLQAVLPALMASPLVGLDTETTGLDPFTHHLRLVQLALPTRTFVVDALQCPLALLAPLLAHPGTTFVGHNLKFDLQFLVTQGLPWPASLLDTMLLAQLLGASGARTPKGFYSLEQVVERTLQQPLDKTLQTSDWHGELSTDQLTYAAQDAAVLLPLAQHLLAGCRDAGLVHIQDLEMQCLPALVWMELAGVPLDQAAWLERAGLETSRAVGIEAELYASLAPRLQHSGVLVPEAVNWDSVPQVLGVFQDLGYAVTSTNSKIMETLAPTERLAALLLDYREARKRVSTYGAAWLQRYAHPLTHRVHADYHQLGSRAGRLSCSDPNMQQVPRGPLYRSCIRPAPGRCLVKADYSQIELRIGALVANEPAMLEALQAGADLHRLTAAHVLGTAPEAVTADERQLAKALNFGLLYGMGAPRLQAHAFSNYKVALTLAEAQAYRTSFFRLYPALGAWHARTNAAKRQDGVAETRTLWGRRRTNVVSYMEALNSPVQGTAADGLKLAMVRLFTHRHEAPDARLILSVHDELVAECPQEQAEATARWLQQHMVAAMEEVVSGEVPIEVETTSGLDWAGTPVP